MKKSDNWLIPPATIFSMGPIIPVLVIDNIKDALPIAEALLSANIKVLEVTLRTPNALEVITKIAKELPEAIVGAGTVINEIQLQQCIDAGAKFSLSPGSTKTLLQAGKKSEIALIPGITTATELMDCMDLGYDHVKFFPAQASGGESAIKAIGGPFPHIRFCPTGGININNAANYLSLPNIPCIGGSWLVTPDIVKHKNWTAITSLAKQSLEKLT